MQTMPDLLFSTGPIAIVSAEALFIWAGKWNCYAKFNRYTDIKNYYNMAILVQVTVDNVGILFRDTVYVVGEHAEHL